MRYRTTGSASFPSVTGGRLRRRASAAALSRRRRQRRRRAYFDFDEDGGDVVLAAALVGHLDEALDRGLAAERATTADLVVAQVAVQPVGAEQEAIARARARRGPVSTST